MIQKARSLLASRYPATSKRSLARTIGFASQEIHDVFEDRGVSSTNSPSSIFPVSKSQAATFCESEQQSPGHSSSPIIATMSCRSSYSSSCGNSAAAITPGWMPFAILTTDARFMGKEQTGHYQYYPFVNVGHF